MACHYHFRAPQAGGCLLEFRTRPETANPGRSGEEQKGTKAAKMAGKTQANPGCSDTKGKRLPPL